MPSRSSAMGRSSSPERARRTREKWRWPATQRAGHSTRASAPAARCFIKTATPAAKAVAIQPDGKILVAGHGDAYGTYDGSGGADFQVARLTPSGTLDRGFG